MRHLEELRRQRRIPPAQCKYEGQAVRTDHEIQILTNLPKNVSARKVAEAYLQRWQIETAFYELDALFEG
ncbi:MAG: hypothetical protein KDB14_16385, partial [Planctomycetales bacterium]|nr:hypothetical protein [Planctomycetales bacterium]